MVNKIYFKLILHFYHNQKSFQNKKNKKILKFKKNKLIHIIIQIVLLKF